ncbi:MAG: hypothetical protein KAI17_15230, partial [Thiotrichaceae bacterium]|nr:hypothetical protein [Thiotrichaceae bacterium]
MPAAAKTKGFRVTVEGEYFTPGVAGKKGLGTYKIEVMLPKMEAALSVIKNKLLDRAIKLKHPESVGYRTHTITNVVCLDGSSAVNAITPNEMNYSQLIEYVANKKLPVDPETFPEIAHLRAAIILAENDPKEFARKQAIAAEDQAENKALAELNPGLSAQKETNVGQRTASGAD